MTDPQIVEGVLYGADELVAEWVQARLGGGKVFQPFTALGVVAGDDIAGGVVFFNAQEHDIQAAVASASPAAWRPRAIARCMAYPFRQLGTGRVSAEVELHNERSARLLEGLGFVREGTKRKAASDGSHVRVYGLLEKDFRLKGYMP